jgi:pyruvate dehydrogenase E1 component alpha subunit
VEITTYRYLEHVGPNTDWDEGYRTREEVEAHMAMDPLESTKEHLLEQGLSDEISALEQEIEALIMNAFERAESAPWPRWSDNPMVDGEIVSQMAAKHTSVEAND